jgi:hypothetical protein
LEDSFLEDFSQKSEHLITFEHVDFLPGTFTKISQRAPFSLSRDRSNYFGRMAIGASPRATKSGYASIFGRKRFARSFEN